MNTQEYGLEESAMRLQKLTWLYKHHFIDDDDAILGRDLLILAIDELHEEGLWDAACMIVFKKNRKSTVEYHLRQYPDTDMKELLLYLVEELY